MSEKTLQLIVVGVVVAIATQLILKKMNMDNSNDNGQQDQL